MNGQMIKEQSLNIELQYGYGDINSGQSCVC